VYVKTNIVRGAHPELSSSFLGVGLKFVTPGFEPNVCFVRDGDRSDGQDLTIALCLSSDSGIGNLGFFESEDSLPLAAVLKACTFDLEGFMDGAEDTVEGAFLEALNHALNVLGSIVFFRDDGAVVAEFTFGRHKLTFLFDEEATAKYFQTS
jgi:hypothetical protein